MTLTAIQTSGVYGLVIILVSFFGWTGYMLERILEELKSISQIAPKEKLK